MTLCRLLVEVGDGNMTVLVEEVGGGECGGSGEMGENGEQREEMAGEAEAGQLALDISQQLLVRITHVLYKRVGRLSM